MNQRMVGYPSTSWASCIFRKSVLLFLCWFILGIIRHTVSLSAQLPKVAKQVAEWSYWFEFLPLHVVSTVRRPTLSHYENISHCNKKLVRCGNKIVCCADAEGESMSVRQGVTGWSSMTTFKSAVPRAFFDMITRRTTGRRWRDCRIIWPLRRAIIKYHIILFNCNI